MILQRFRQQFIFCLLENYRQQCLQLQQVEAGLQQLGISAITFDHFAVIDLPSTETGIAQMREIFTALGYQSRGSGYLPDKQNDFHWLATAESDAQSPASVLPQAVVADFRLDELPVEVRAIISKYSEQAPAAPVRKVQQLTKQLHAGDMHAANSLQALLLHYFTGRDWPLPTTKEFHTVQEFNELLAWVLIFGRRPNHFTISVHLLQHFPHLAAFLEYIEKDLDLALNKEAGAIKGSKHDGIAQGSTAGVLRPVSLSDGTIELPSDFVEFVWRFSTHTCPEKWSDYFTGFVAKNADNVIRSLFSEK